MQALGYVKAAVCIDCHAVNASAHTRIVNKESKLSPINPVNREETCTQEGCHVASGVKVFPGNMHGGSELRLFGISIEAVIDAFYISIITFFVGGALVFIILDISRKKVGGH
jgi:hypothetical protein